MPGDWLANALRWIQSTPIDEAASRDIESIRIPNDPATVIGIGMELLNGLRERPAELESLRSGDQSANKSLRERFGFLCRNYGAALQRASLDSDETDDARLPESIGLLASNLYRTLHPYAVTEGEGLFLQALAWPRTDEAISELAELLVELPPHDWTATAMGLSPLMRSDDWSVDAVFPRLLGGLEHPSTIASVLDLANFCVHRNMIDEHPAVGLEDSLTQMLGGVVGRLGLMEDDPTKFGNTPEKIQRFSAMRSRSAFRCATRLD